jgi:sulfite exporter TauE/SafE
MPCWEGWLADSGRRSLVPRGLTTVVGALLLVGFSASLAGLVPEPRFTLPGVRRLGGALGRQSGPLASLGFGVVNGLLPCGLLYATLAVPVASGSALSGAALMALFGLWTSLPLAAATYGLRRMLVGRPARLVLASIVLVTGLAGLARRGHWADAEEAPCHSP